MEKSESAQPLEREIGRFNDMDGSGNRNNKYDDEKKLQQKLKAALIPDSVFIKPFQKQGFQMVNMVRYADKLMSTVKRKFGTGVGLDDANHVFETFRNLSNEMWDFVYEISPNLHHMKPEMWRKINDDKTVKTNLAHQRNSTYVVPRSEEAAMIAMAVKIIQYKNIEIRNSTAPFEEIAEFIDKYRDVITQFDSVLVDVSGRLKDILKGNSKFEYKSYLSEFSA